MSDVHLTKSQIATLLTYRDNNNPARWILDSNNSAVAAQIRTLIKDGLLTSKHVMSKEGFLHIDIEISDSGILALERKSEDEHSMLTSKRESRIEFTISALLSLAAIIVSIFALLNN